MRGYMDAENSVNLNAIKSGPHRIIVPMNRGFLEGSGLKAQVLPGSGDWILVRAAVSHPVVLLSQSLIDS